MILDLVNSCIPWVMLRVRNPALSLHTHPAQVPLACHLITLDTARGLKYEKNASPSAFYVLWWWWSKCQSNKNEWNFSSAQDKSLITYEMEGNKASRMSHGIIIISLLKSHFAYMMMGLKHIHNRGGIFSSSIYHSLAFSSTKIYGPFSWLYYAPLSGIVEENISWLQSANNKSLIYNDDEFLSYRHCSSRDHWSEF